MDAIGLRPTPGYSHHDWCRVHHRLPWFHYHIQCREDCQNVLLRIMSKNEHMIGNSTIGRECFFLACLEPGLTGVHLLGPSPIVPSNLSKRPLEGPQASDLVADGPAGES
jgi:hypothetical protein